MEGEQENGVYISGSPWARQEVGLETEKNVHQWARGWTHKKAWKSFRQIKSKVNKQLVWLSRMTDDLFFNSSRKRKQTTFLDVRQLEKTTFHASTSFSNPLGNTCFNHVRPLPLSLRNVHPHPRSSGNTAVTECSQYILVFDEWIDISSHTDVLNIQATM